MEITKMTTQAEYFDKFKEQPTVSESDLKTLLYGIKEVLGESFITCNSGGKDGYNILMQTKTLKEAHKLHRLLCELNAL
jgi:hypothetical protein